MSSMQFNYFADKKGECFIRQELLKKMRNLYFSQGKYINKKEKLVQQIVDFPTLSNKMCVFVLTKDELKAKIQTDEDGYIKLYESPILEYTLSFIRDYNVYVAGRLAYFAGDKFPEFKKEVQSLFRKLKKHCWKDKQWQSWVFETIGDEATVFIPNKVVHLKKEMKENRT